jgi:hypothetical protein
MTTELAERRKRRALSWVVGAIASLGVAATTVAIDVRSAQPDRVVGPVVPDLARQLPQAQKISIVSRDASYRIARTQRGWAMTDRGDFPVRAARLHQLTQGLTNLAYVRRMTSDPARHDRLGVVDPREGGAGVLIQIENARGGFLVDLILGVERDGLYVRRPGENQVWAVRGELPPLRDASVWLDLEPLALDASLLRRVEIVPSEGDAYVLERPTEDADFAFAGSLAGRSAVSAAALTDTAERITRLEPIDVLRAPAVQGPRSAALRAVAANGVLIDAEIVQFEQKPWLKLVARFERPEAQAAADAINARASGWAYALSAAEYESLAPKLETLLPTAAPATPPLPNRTPPPAQPPAR